MHVSHQQHLLFSIRSSLEAIETALKGQANEGANAHPSLVAERKAAIIQNLDNLHRHLEQVEPVLREQNQ